MGYEEILGAQEDAELESLLSAAAGLDEIVGQDYLAGDDEVAALLGARVPRVNAASNAARAAIAQKIARHKALVTQRGYGVSRTYPLGFDSGAVLILAGAAPVNGVIATPQVPFKGKRLAVAASIAASWLINSIFVGKNPQMAAIAAMPAETFAQTAQGVEIDFDTCQANMQIIINCTNISLAPARFLATLYGIGLDK